MAIYRALENASFEPDVIAILSTTFEELCCYLGLAQITDPLRDRVAQSIVGCAQRGIRDPIVLRKCALEDLGHVN